MRPVINFLLRFLGIYVVLSVGYGFYIAHYDTLDPPLTDPVTAMVTRQTAQVAKFLGYSPDVLPNDHLQYHAEAEQTYDTLLLNDVPAIAVEEGCNGISVAILFMAFVVGFGGRWKSMIWFLPAGVIILHLANLARLILLAWLSVETEGNAFHFFHKFGFTAVIYAAVFVIWIWWVRSYGRRPETVSTQ